MKFNIRGHKVEITESIKDYIESKIGKLDKYLDNPENLTAKVVVRTHGVNQIIEVTIPIKKVIIRGEESHKDLYAAIDLVSEKIERQIRKNKTKINRRNSKATEIGFTDFEVTSEEDEDNAIVKRKTIETKPMDEEEAILQMNLLGHGFFVFNNIATEAISVVYKRKDDNYGIIDVK